jgi:hypothetical protein
MIESTAPNPTPSGDLPMNAYCKPIELIRPEAIEFGCGTIAAVARFARTRGAKRPLVIADAFNAARVGMLELPGEVSVFGEVKPEPDIPNWSKRSRWRGRSRRI